MPARLTRFQIPAKDVEAAKRFCSKVVASQTRRDAEVVRLRWPEAARPVPGDWAAPSRAIAA